MRFEALKTFTPTAWSTRQNEGVHKRQPSVRPSVRCYSLSLLYGATEDGEKQIVHRTIYLSHNDPVHVPAHPPSSRDRTILLGVLGDQEGPACPAPSPARGKSFFIRKLNGGCNTCAGFPVYTKHNFRRRLNSIETYGITTTTTVRGICTRARFPQKKKKLSRSTTSKENTNNNKKAHAQIQSNTTAT